METEWNDAALTRKIKARFQVVTRAPKRFGETDVAALYTLAVEALAARDVVNVASALREDPRSLAGAHEFLRAALVRTLATYYKRDRSVNGR